MCSPHPPSDYAPRPFTDKLHLSSLTPPHHQPVPRSTASAGRQPVYFRPLRTWQQELVWLACLLFCWLAGTNEPLLPCRSCSITSASKGQEQTRPVVTDHLPQAHSDSSSNAGLPLWLTSIHFKILVLLPIKICWEIEGVIFILHFISHTAVLSAGKLICEH